ncbi:MAG: hypothetical protein Kow0047_15120 [Anaerolineae bacterium]
MRMSIKIDTKELQRALANWTSRYDPDERMVIQPFSSPGYHTTLTGGMVHPTRESLSYALALLDSGDPGDLERACAILDRVLDLQDANPASPTYGIWPWFLEEPLSQMSPPDWNWADFCGTSLIQIAMDHRDRLPARLAERLDAATLHAARSIQRRNMGPHYTNIALMGTYVTYTVGEFYGIGDLLDYARARLDRFAEYTRYHGAFTEFNSPTYSAVAIRVLARMRRDIRDLQAQDTVRWLYDLAWEDVGLHFHPATRQWAGPHSRCYSTLLRPGERAFLQRGTRGAVRYFDDDALPVDIEAHRLDFSCPERWLPLFARLDGPRELHRIYHRGSELYPMLIGHTYMDDLVALGSMNRGDLWNQRRPLVGYWGRAEDPWAVQLRCLHDGYDYSAALTFCRQSGPYVLCAVAFATDYGDRHITLDPIKEQGIEAYDLRLRLEVMRQAQPPTPPRIEGDAPQQITFGAACMGLQIPYAVFSEPCRITSGMEGDRACLDVILYEGERRRIDFAAMSRAAVVFGLVLKPANAQDELPPVSVVAHGERIDAAWETPHGTLTLSISQRPGPFRRLEESAAGVDDV